jgi:hypothetical protein
MRIVASPPPETSYNDGEDAQHRGESEQTAAPLASVSIDVCDQRLCGQLVDLLRLDD